MVRVKVRYEDFFDIIILNPKFQGRPGKSLTGVKLIQFRSDLKNKRRTSPILRGKPRSGTGEDNFVQADIFSSKKTAVFVKPVLISICGCQPKALMIAELSRTLRLVSPSLGGLYNFSWSEPMI